MLEPLITPVVNRLLRSNSWAAETLRPHAGKVVMVSCPPTTLRLIVLDSGEVAAAPLESAPAATISLTPGLLLRAAARDPNAWGSARVAGDADFAGALDYVRRNIRWDYEEDLSRVFGDVAAHRMANAARAVDRWGRTSAMNLGRAAAEYAIYEQPLLASGPAVDEFVRAVDVLRDDTARLEKRIALLQRQLTPGSSP